MTGFTSTSIPLIMMYFGTKGESGMTIPREMTVHTFHEKATLPRDMTDSVLSLLENKKDNILKFDDNLYYVNSYSHRCPGSESNTSTSTTSSRVDKKSGRKVTTTTVTTTTTSDIAEGDKELLSDKIQRDEDELTIYADDIITPTKWEPVTMERIALATVHVDDVLTVQQVLDRYYSLHAVKLENNKWICDCKQYHKNGFVCAHSLAVMDTINVFDIGSNYSALDGPKKKGRPKKHTPALSK
jgi:hypothetical protein